ncbi:MAG: hypothetical protein AAB443_01720 [Patescibacteria group bacterium]
MFSRILTKLIDEAILPAVLLIGAKVIGVLAVAKYYSIEVSPNSTFFSLYFSRVEDFLQVNSYSVALMLGVIFIGGFFFLIKSRLFHDTHIKPVHSQRLFSLGLSHFISTSFDIYSQGTIWLSYAFLLTVVCGMELFFGMLYPWVFIASLAITFFLTLILVSDVEREI